MFNHFPSIKGFHNVNKNIQRFMDNENFVVTYIAKTKIHGTNAGITITPDGFVFAQSREHQITPDQDNHGFAKFVEDTKTYWQNMKQDQTITVYGEWFGPGIMKGTAANQIDRKHFGIFALYFSEDNTIETEPTKIQEHFPNVPENVLTIPCYVFENGETEFAINFNNCKNMNSSQELLNSEIERIEKCDPFFKEYFGVEGLGEGIVLVPKGETDREFYKTISFKAKGEKHQVVKQKQPVRVDPETANNIEQFVNNVLTQSRLEQAMLEGVGSMDFEMSNIGLFLKWVGQDVKKECMDELEQSGLEWDKKLTKCLNNKARLWFKNCGKIEEG